MLALYLNSGLILTFYVFSCSDIWLYRSAHFGLQGLLCYLRCNKWGAKVLEAVLELVHGVKRGNFV